MANFIMRGGPKIRAVTNPLRSFLGLTSGVSLVSLELGVMSVDGTSVEASLSGAAPSSLADIVRDVCNRFARIVPEHWSEYWLKRGDDMAVYGRTVLLLAGESVEIVKARQKKVQADSLKASSKILDAEKRIVSINVVSVLTRS